MNNLKAVEIGNVLWSVEFGFGKVIEITREEPTSGITVSFWNGAHCKYNFRGITGYNKYPTLFWDKPDLYISESYPKDKKPISAKEYYEVVAKIIQEKKINKR